MSCSWRIKREKGRDEEEAHVAHASLTLHTAPHTCSHVCVALCHTGLNMMRDMLLPVSAKNPDVSKADIWCAVRNTTTLLLCPPPISLNASHSFYVFLCFGSLRLVSRCTSPICSLLPLSLSLSLSLPLLRARARSLPPSFSLSILCARALALSLYLSCASLEIHIICAHWLSLTSREEVFRLLYIFTFISFWPSSSPLLGLYNTPLPFDYPLFLLPSSYLAVFL